MGDFTKYLIEFVIQLIALAPIWWCIWFIVKRFRQQEKKIVYLLETLNALVHAHNMKNYRRAQRIAEELTNQTELDAVERDRLERALKTIMDFEKSYNIKDDSDEVPDPQNN